MGFFPLGSFTGGLFSGAQNTIQLMGEVQKYKENEATFADRAQAYKDAIKTNQPQGTQPAQPAAALPSAPVAPVTTEQLPPPDVSTAVPLSPAAGSPQVSPATPTVVPPPAAAPGAAPSPLAAPPPVAAPAPIVSPPVQGGGMDPATAATPPPAPAPAPAKQSALGGQQTQTADASGGKTHTSDAPLVYLPPGEFSAQTRGQAAQAQAGYRAPPSQVTALAGANFPTVGRA
jgi:hypothetical protein